MPNKAFHQAIQYLSTTPASRKGSEAGSENSVNKNLSLKLAFKTLLEKTDLAEEEMNRILLNLHDESVSVSVEEGVMVVNLGFLRSHEGEPALKRQKSSKTGVRG